MDKTIGVALSVLRDYCGVRLATLGKSMGKSYDFLLKVESGKSNATIEVINGYANYFHIHKSDILVLAERIEQQWVPHFKWFSDMGVTDMAYLRNMAVMAGKEKEQGANCSESPNSSKEAGNDG